LKGNRITELLAAFKSLISNYIIVDSNKLVLILFNFAFMKQKILKKKLPIYRRGTKGA
jgi:hypothetical protein